MQKHKLWQKGEKACFDKPAAAGVEKQAVFSLLPRRLKKYNEENEQKLDYIVINDTVETAAEAICAIVKAESMKSSRNINIKQNFI